MKIQAFARTLNRVPVPPREGRPTLEMTAEVVNIVNLTGTGIT